jgi:hypothetical protein
MSSAPMSNESMLESLRLIDALEQRRTELPFADTLLSTHKTVHGELEHCHDLSTAAVDSWRAALAQRWDYEVAARRLYKQILRQLAEHYGEDAPQMHMVSRGGAEANSSPTELLEDLRRLQALLMVITGQLDFAAGQLEQLTTICRELELAIETARMAEHRRREAVLDSRMAREAFRRTCEETFGVLSAHYGERFVEEFQEFLDVPVA